MWSYATMWLVMHRVMQIVAAPPALPSQVAELCSPPAATSALASASQSKCSAGSKSPTRSSWSRRTSSHQRICPCACGKACKYGHYWNLGAETGPAVPNQYVLCIILFQHWQQPLIPQFRAKRSASLDTRAFSECSKTSNSFVQSVPASLEQSLKTPCTIVIGNEIKQQNIIDRMKHLWYKYHSR